SHEDPRLLILREKARWLKRSSRQWPATYASSVMGSPSIPGRALEPSALRAKVQHDAPCHGATRSSPQQTGEAAARRSVHKRSHYEPLECLSPRRPLTTGLFVNHPSRERNEPRQELLRCTSTPITTPELACKEVTRKERRAGS